MQPISLFIAQRGDTAPAAQDSEPGRAVILLDFLNTIYVNQLFARDQAADLLKHYEPRQKIALYLLNDDPGMILPFTLNRDELLAVLERVQFKPDPAPVNRPLQEQLFDLNRKVERTAEAFRHLAADLAHFPGRKTVLWVTTGFPVTVDGSVIRGAHRAEFVYTGEVERMLAPLNTGDTAVYAIDACGLSTKCRSFHDSLYELSRRTGGTVFADRNDLDTGMRKALEDLAVSYTLGFDPGEDSAPGLHELQLKVNRPGIKLRYRESYRLVH